ncbi:MAG: hypothetical protein R2771_11035 [Saprospiraceae bacterium]
MTNFDKIEQNIKENNINPTPKWHFQLKDFLIWTMYAIFILIGSISFSIILFAIQQTDFILTDHIGHSALELILVLLPFLWLGTLLVFLIGSFISIYNSKKGYKFSFGKMLGINIGFSIVFGTILFLFGAGEWFEKTFSVYSSTYESIQIKKEKLWTNADSGVVAGTIINLENDTLYLLDFEKHNWKINIDSAFKVPIVKLIPDEKVKILGKKYDKNIFIAEKILPWGGKDMRNKMQNRWKNNGTH